MAFVDEDGLVHTDEESDEYADGEEIEEYDDDEEIEGEGEYSEEEDGMVVEGGIPTGFGTIHALAGSIL